MTITPDDLVRREVAANVSALVSTLAGAYGTLENAARAQERGHNRAADLADLCEQAAELAAPIDDWEEAAIQEGWTVRHDVAGFYYLTDDEALCEDAGNPSAGFDGRAHFQELADAWRGCCEDHDLDPINRDVYEHWIVSSWLAKKLEAKGEKVDHDFAGLTVWARTTTGQSIAMDCVIKAICADLNTPAESQ